MQATLFWSRKTKKSAERLAAEWAADIPEANYRVIEHDGLYWVGRDYHPSDEGRSYLIKEVSA